MRSLAVILVLSALVTSFPAHAQAPALVADAGVSQVAFDGEPLHLLARAMGGQAPYAFAWTASAGALTDPAAAAPDLLTSGLSVGTDITVTLTVRDAVGSVASATVKEHVGVRTTLVDQDVAIKAGVPDEAAGDAVDRTVVSFRVPAGAGSVVARLAWPDAIDQIYLDINNVADGKSLTGTQGRTGSSPEVATLTDPQPIVYQAAVEPYVSGPETAHLTIVASSSGAIPTAFVGSSPYWEEPTFGSTDAQTLTAFPRGGVAPYAIKWDVDGDGFFETSGASATFALTPGDHVVGARVEDAAGFSAIVSTPVHVDAAQQAKYAICGGNANFTLWTMEFTATHGTCWIHDGHHTYFLGEHEYAFRALHGYAFDVEQQFAPSLPDPAFVTDPLHRLLTVEVSADGRSWTTVGHGAYGLAIPADQANDTYERQKVFFDITGDGTPFRFLRIHNPASLSQGLSGYLDHTQLRLLVDDLGPAPVTAPAPGTRALSCDNGDNLEDFFPATHPCWFGGIDRYDATSFYETYFVGDGAVLDRVNGSFTLLPFRDDDFTTGYAATQARFTKAFVQTSLDGVNWTTRATVPAAYGVAQPYDITLPHVAARFVRLFPEYHYNFDRQGDPTCGCASEHHPRGYFVHTDATVSGLLPT